MLSDEEIKLAKQKIIYSQTDFFHEHNDCIRIAYEWLDAQKKIKNPSLKSYDLKRFIERWGGRYVSRADVELAAFLHPMIQGKYPYYNISARLTEPDVKRLQEIGEAFKHQDYRDRYDSSIYKEQEENRDVFVNKLFKARPVLRKKDIVRVEARQGANLESLAEMCSSLHVQCGSIGKLIVKKVIEGKGSAEIPLSDLLPTLDTQGGVHEMLDNFNLYESKSGSPLLFELIRKSVGDEE